MTTSRRPPPPPLPPGAAADTGAARRARLTPATGAAAAARPPVGGLRSRLAAAPEHPERLSAPPPPPSPGGSRLSTSPQPTPTSPPPEAAVTPPAVPSGPGYDFGAPPPISAELLARCGSGASGVICVLVPAADVPGFFERPEPLEVFRRRVAMQSEALGRLQDFGGELELAAQGLQGRPDWGSLRTGLRDEDSYQRVVVRGLAAHEVQRRRERLRADVLQRFDDDVLTMSEQHIVQDLARQLGLGPQQVDETVRQVCAELRAGGRTVEVEKVLLRRRGAVDIVGVDALPGLCSDKLPEVLAELREAISQERLQNWLTALNCRDHPAWQASERATDAACRTKPGTDEERQTLTLGAWDVLWAAGLRWVELEPGVSPGAVGVRTHSVRELAAQVTKHGVDLLRDPVTAGLLEAWLLSLPEDRRPHDLLVATRVAAQELGRQRAKGTRPALRLWEVAWAAGVKHLDLAWRDGAKSESRRLIDSAGDLRDAFEQAGPEVLDGSAQLGLLAPWLEGVARGLPPLVGAAKELQEALRVHGGKQLAVRQARWRVGWRAGVPSLPVNDEHTLRTREDLLAADPHLPALVRLANEGLLQMWLAEVVASPEERASLAVPLGKLLPNLPRTTLSSHEALLEVQRACWVLGKQSLNFGELRVARPDPKAILDAALQSPKAWRDLGACVQDGSVAVWVAVVPNALTPKQRQDLAALARLGSPPEVLAQMAALVLGQPDLVVFSEGAAAPPLASLLATPLDLAERAHGLWAELSAPLVRAATQAWLAAVGAFGDSHLGTPSADVPLNELLAAAGDTTVRRADGVPLGQVAGRRFGSGAPDDRDPEQIRERLVLWMEAQPSPPPEVRQAHYSGALLRWLELHLPERAAELKQRLEEQRTDEAKLLATLWAFGYSRLVVTPEVSVATVAELVSRARDLLPAIERLFDQRVLDAWAPDAAARRALTVLHAAVERATYALEHPDHSAANRSAVVRDWLLPQCTMGDSVLMEPLHWLLLRDRASLAVVALGGQADRWRLRDQTLFHLPADQAVELPAEVELLERRDVPIHALLLDAHRCVRSAPALLDPGPAEAPVVGQIVPAHFASGEAEARGRHWQEHLTLHVAPLDPALRDSDQTKDELSPAPEEGGPATVDVHINYPYPRLAQALLRGLLYGLPSVGIMALILWGIAAAGANLSVFAWVSWLLATAAGALTGGLKQHKLVGLMWVTAVVGVLPLLALLF